MSGRAYSLLIVDDEYWVRENLKAMLSAPKLPIFLLEPAVDGEDAVRRIESERPDILITDITMPFTNGNELIKTVKRRYPQTSVIVLSGYQDFSFVRDALLDGAVDYLLKPVTQDALFHVLDKAVSLVDATRAKEKESAELRKKLAIASSIIRDEAMSALIADDATVITSGRSIADLDLQFAAFSLVLVKLTDLPRLLRKGAVDIPAISRAVKDALSRCAGAAKTVPFHNTYASSEFVLLTDLDEQGMARLCADLPGRLEGCTGSRVRLAVSGCYFSFDRLRAAYQEARAALLTRAIGTDSAGIRVEEARKTTVKKRLTAEMENHLLFALETGHRKLAREVVFDQTGLRGCEREGWLLIEVKQTAEYIAGLIIQHAALDVSAGAALSLESIADILAAALWAEDMAEVRSALDQLIDEVFADQVPAGVSHSTLETVRKVEAHISEKYFEPLSLTTLAKLFAIERSHLSKAFKQVTGCNLMFAIARRRIEKASVYIRRGDLSLTEISYLVGYEEYAYFSRVFRKIMGVSPSEYRAAAEKERAQG